MKHLSNPPRGIITPSPRKSLVTLAFIVGLKNSQSWDNFLTQSPGKYQELSSQRIKLILDWLKGEAINIIIAQTGDPKKGSRTELVNDFNTLILIFNSQPDNYFHFSSLI